MLFAYHWVYCPAARACVTYLPLRQQQEKPTTAAAAAAASAAQPAMGEEKGASSPVQEGEEEEGEGGGNGNGNEEGEDAPGPVDKEEEAAAAVRAELIVIDDSSSDRSLVAPPLGQQEEEGRAGGDGGGRVPVFERPPREEVGLEALDLPVVGPGVDLEAVLGCVGADGCVGVGGGGAALFGRWRSRLTSFITPTYIQGQDRRAVRAGRGGGAAAPGDAPAPRPPRHPLHLLLYFRTPPLLKRW